MTSATLSLLAGCATPEPVVQVREVKVPYEVKVPVYIKDAPPGELTRKYVPTEFPEFSSSPDGGICLTPANYARLQVILRTLVVREKAWKDWANKEVKKP